jgi:peptidylprolyl isomerase
MTPSLRVPVVAVGTLLLLLGGCAGEDPKTSAGTGSGGELQIIDLKEGTGAEAKKGKTVVVHYTGTFQNGKKFDSSVDRNDPFVFDLGSGQVIKGWDQGIAGMKVGGKRKLVIPSELAYGKKGRGTIPPDAALTFEVELLGLPEVTIVDEKVGDGAEAKPGTELTVHYTGTLKDGTKFDSSRDRGKPITMELGAGQVIKGWEQGIPGMKVGGKRKLIIPPELGYGKQAQGPIPPNSELNFDVELLGVTKIPEVTIIDERVGTGAVAEKGSKVNVVYKGTLRDGTVFDKGTISVVVGAGEVIKGWDKGIPGMKVGGKRKLVIPPELAYGKLGQGPIPPNSELTFEIELQDVK